MSAEQAAVDILRLFPVISKFQSIVMTAGGGVGAVAGAYIVLKGGEKITLKLAEAAGILAGIGGVAGVLIGYSVSTIIQHYYDERRKEKLKKEVFSFIKDLKKKNDPNSEKLEKFLDCYNRGLLNEIEFCDHIKDIILEYCKK